MPDRFRETAERIAASERERESVCTIEQVISRYEREMRMMVVSYEDYLLATRRSVGKGLIAPVDRHWYEAWQRVRGEAFRAPDDKSSTGP